MMAGTIEDPREKAEKLANARNRFIKRRRTGAFTGEAISSLHV